MPSYALATFNHYTIVQTIDEAVKILSIDCQLYNSAVGSAGHILTEVFSLVSTQRKYQVLASLVWKAESALYTIKDSYIDLQDPKFGSDHYSFGANLRKRLQRNGDFAANMEMRRP